ncbi:hypothetical protein H7B90_23480 [Cohnella xylanilytica]|uniref:Uncharacterized protein n=1 Tax=Cohnella xylanilytica TaxID=557555 RepID=A0A841U496_9BACL|nr:hypothetical protein [Cohnella xylanilytica]MBB6694362.1 hypothetical protein [Cohnella xylanilytica]
MSRIDNIRKRLQIKIGIEQMKELPAGSKNILLDDIQYLLSKLEIAEKALEVSRKIIEHHAEVVDDEWGSGSQKNFAQLKEEGEIPKEWYIVDDALKQIKEG